MSEVKTGSVRAYNKHLKKGLIKCDDGSSDIPIYTSQAASLQPITLPCPAAAVFSNGIARDSDAE